MLEQNTVVVTKTIDLKPICCNLCMLGGTCIYSEQHAFIAILSIDKELVLYQPPEFNLEDMNAQIRQWFGTVGWFVQLLGAVFAGAPIVMFINIFAGESAIRKTCNFDKPLNHILKVMDGCMHIFCLVKHQNTQN